LNILLGYRGKGGSGEIQGTLTTTTPDLRLTHRGGGAEIRKDIWGRTHSGMKPVKKLSNKTKGAGIGLFQSSVLGLGKKGDQLEQTQNSRGLTIRKKE